MRECADQGIKHVWMHRSFATGGVSEAAAEYGRRHGVSVIDGGCLGFSCRSGPLLESVGSLH
jgi:hypothetical protein